MGVFWGAEFIFDIYFDIFRHFFIILEQFSKIMKKFNLQPNLPKATKKLGMGVFRGAEFIFDIYFDIFSYFS